MSLTPEHGWEITNMAGFLFVYFLVCTCMCSMPVFVCKYEDINIRWGNLSFSTFCF